MFSSRVTDRVEGGLKNVPDAHRIAVQLASGRAQSAIASAPAGERQRVAEVAQTAFISGLNHILVLAAIVAACGAVLATSLVRPRDFIASGPPPADTG